MKCDNDGPKSLKLKLTKNAYLPAVATFAVQASEDFDFSDCENLRLIYSLLESDLYCLDLHLTDNLQR